MAKARGTVRQTFVLPADLVKKIDKAAAESKRSRKAMLEILLRQALSERERRFKRLHEVVVKIQAAPTDEAAAQYDEELLEALFGPQRRTSTQKPTAKSA
jgi:metal-responsive CopG/Arc/MetJ family transcriptional regulator